MIKQLLSDLLVSTETSSIGLGTILLYALLGICIVITLLGILCVLIITILPLISKIGNKKTKELKGASKDNEVVIETTINEKVNNDEQLVAVIIAAICASQNVKPESFRVVSFNKI